MQKILSFATIFQGVDVVFQEDGNIISAKNFESKKQSEILVASLESTLGKYNINYSDVDVFSSIAGPGNFTGIKTSLAVLKSISIALNKNIVLVNVFEIIAHNVSGYDMILLDMGTVKYYVEKNGTYWVIYKKNIVEFLESNRNLRILTNDIGIKGNNIIYASFNNEKWADLVYSKVKNGIFVNNSIEPLYIEDALITERKK